MSRLRSFLYLDNYKMYSFSSQLFEGLTEYIVKSKGEKAGQSETQNNPAGSGKVLADIIETDTLSTEKKFLHDFAYNLFEDALISQDKVLQIDKESVDSVITRISDYRFVKVKGRVAFNDLKQVGHTISNFNSLGEALGYITMKNAYESEIKEIKSEINSIKDRNQKAKAEALFKNKTDFKKILKEQNLYFDPDFLKHLAYVLEYGYNEQFEVQIPIASESQYFLFSAQLNRDNLKDNEYRIIKKFSRETEREFALFGILTQVQPASEKINLLEKAVNKVNSDEGSANMKEALMNMVTLLTNVEKTFTGKLDYEYIIDPISLYLEL